MKLVSWNVNGLRSAEEKFLAFVDDFQPDILMLQEVRAFPEQLSLFLHNIPGYHVVFNPAEKPGYSGTAVYYKHDVPVDTSEGLYNHPQLNVEGRSIVITIGNTHIVNVYTPNGTSGAERLNFKLDFCNYLGSYLNALRAQGHPVIIGGDLNVAHTEKDLYNPKGNRNHSGFLESERSWFQHLLDAGFHDSFRLFEEDGDHYSWWHLRDPKRAANQGWRFDYFLVSDDLRPQVTGASILKDVYGSDHAPIVLEVDM